MRVLRDIRTWIAIASLLVAVGRCAHAYAWTDDPLAGQWRYVGFAGLHDMMAVSAATFQGIDASMTMDPGDYVAPARLYHHIDATKMEGYGQLVGCDPSTSTPQYEFYHTPSGGGPWVNARGTGTLAVGEPGAQWIGMRATDEWYCRYTYGEYWIQLAPDGVGDTFIAETGACNDKGPAATQFWTQVEQALAPTPDQTIQGQRWGEMWVMHRVGSQWQWKYRLVVLPTKFLPDPWGRGDNYKIEKSLSGSSSSTSAPCVDLGGVNPIYGWNTDSEVGDHGWGAAYESWNTSICVEVWNSAEMPPTSPAGIGSLDDASGWPSFLGDAAFQAAWTYLQPMRDWMTSLTTSATAPLGGLLWPLELFEDAGE